MKKFFDSLKSIFKKYSVINKRLDAVTSTKDVIKSVLSALLISFLCVLLPAAIIINMMIFDRIRLLLSLLIVLCVMVWAFLYHLFYYIILKNYSAEAKEINTHIPLIINTILYDSIILIFGLVVVFVFV